jgi:type VI secretion system secreted protein Hcp
MAVDMFLKLDGITGEARDSKHSQEIDVLAWSWGLSQSGTTHMGGGGGAGKVNVQDISLTKYVDNSSPTLVKFCSSGKHIANGNLTVRKAGETPLDYIVMNFEEILVTAVSTGGSGGEDRLTENVVLNFAKFKMTYTPQNADGTPGTAVHGGWDIAENKDNSA